MSATAGVLLVTNNFPPSRGGSGVVYANIARCTGGQVAILAPERNYADGLPLIGWREHDRLAPFPVKRLRLLRIRMAEPGGRLHKAWLLLQDVAIRLQVLLCIAGLIARRRPRAICVGELVASAWLLRALRLVPGLRRVVYVHGEEITTAETYDPGARRRRAALLAADRVVVVSRFTQRAVQDLLGPAASGRIVLIENGVDRHRFQPGPRDPELVARYGLEGRFTFVCVCRLLEKKGVDRALQAFAEVLKTHPGARFVVVGSGPYQLSLEKLAAALRITWSVSFAGNVPEHELVAHYRLGDVFVMPNRALPNGDTEGFGLVFLEANSCGLPVIAGRDGGSTDAVADGVNGLVVDGNSVQAIQDAMSRLIDDDALRERLGQQALEVARDADWSNRADAFLRVCIA